MLPEIKLVITNNHKVIQTVNKELNGQGFAKAIEDFQLIANTTMTKLIEESGDSGDCIMEEDAEDSDNEDDDICISPKRKKK